MHARRRFPASQLVELQLLAWVVALPELTAGHHLSLSPQSDVTHFVFSDAVHWRRCFPAAHSIELQLSAEVVAVPEPTAGHHLSSSSHSVATHFVSSEAVQARRRSPAAQVIELQRAGVQRSERVQRGALRVDGAHELWRPASASFPGRLEELYILMYEYGILGEADVRLDRAQDARRAHRQGRLRARPGRQREARAARRGRGRAQPDRGPAHLRARDQAGAWPRGERREWRARGFSSWRAALARRSVLEAARSSSCVGSLPQILILFSTCAGRKRPSRESK